MNNNNRSKYYGRLPREVWANGILNEREFIKEEEEGIPGRGMCRGGESHKQFKSGENAKTHIKHGGMKAAPWELVRDACFGPQGGKKTLAGLGGEALGREGPYIPHFHFQVTMTIFL